MKKLLLAVAVFALTAGPALAQYYPGNRPPPPPQPQPQPQYQEHYDNRDRGYDYHGNDRDYDRRGPRYDDRRGPPRHRPRICVTSRGSCPVPGYINPGQPCRCDFPGFGSKRGNVQ